MRLGWVEWLLALCAHTVGMESPGDLQHSYPEGASATSGDEVCAGRAVIGRRREMWPVAS